MKLIDTHCHLDLPDFDSDRQQVLDNARNAGVAGFVIPGIRRSGWPALCRFCSSAADLHLALGLHPFFMNEHRPEDLDALQEWIAREEPLAVGEIGLDFSGDNPDQRAQIRLLQAQLEIARSLDLPVLLHVRKAHEQVLTALKAANIRAGICHAFNGSLQQAGRYLDLGLKLGFGGMLTYPRSTKLRKLARELPAEAIVLETDAPDLTVASHRYQRNSPEFLPEILHSLAAARGEDPRQVAQQTTSNACQVLGMRIS